jgi:hypothetical protein
MPRAETNQPTVSTSIRVLRASSSTIGPKPPITSLRVSEENNAGDIPNGKKASGESEEIQHFSSANPIRKSNQHNLLDSLHWLLSVKAIVMWRHVIFGCTKFYHANYFRWQGWISNYSCCLLDVEFRYDMIVFEASCP